MNVANLEHGLVLVARPADPTHPLVKGHCVTELTQ